MKKKASLKSPVCALLDICTLCGLHNQELNYWARGLILSSILNPDVPTLNLIILPWSPHTHPVQNGPAPRWGYRGKTQNRCPDVGGAEREGWGAQVTLGKAWGWGGGSGLWLGCLRGNGVTKRKKGRRRSQFRGEKYEFRMAQEKSWDAEGPQGVLLRAQKSLCVHKA